MALCKVCGTTDAALFYQSIATHCREHWKARVKANRAAKIDYYREFDRARANQPHRVAARDAYAQTEEGRKSHAEANERYAENRPERYRAKNAVNNAVRDGRLVPWPACAVPDCCAEKPEAHHPDYSRPLDVVWLCSPHHKQAHALTKGCT